MKDECQIVQDLLPLVKDDVASEASIVFVQEHCRHFEECKKMLAQENINVNSQSIKNKLVKRLRIMMVGVICLMILFACSFSATQYQFHNFLLLPIIGALGYWLLKRYVFLLYLMIPIMHLLLEMIDASYQEALLPYTLIYWFFMSIGILIYAGYAYALRRENS